MSLRKLLVRTWFGPLPEWTPQFLEHVKPLRQHGWDFLLLTDYQQFASIVKYVLDVDLPPEDLIDKRKSGDWDPYLGAVLKHTLDEYKYDFWGHFNLDAVYGRIHKWLPDSFLENIDIFGNDPGAICGPFSVYRNSLKVNRLFEKVSTWRQNLESTAFQGWDERDFSDEVVRQSLCGNIKFASGFFTSHDHMTPDHKARIPFDRLLDGATKVGFWDGALVDGITGKEVMMYHFNQTRKWPL